MTKGELIRKARKQAGLTQKQLSEIYEIPTRTLEDWETGRRNPIPYVVNLLLRCLAVDYPSGVEDISEQAPKPYTLYNLQGEPLSKADSDYAHQEHKADRTVPIRLSEDEDPFQTRKIYVCTENDLKFEVITHKKEV